MACAWINVNGTPAIICGLKKPKPCKCGSGLEVSRACDWKRRRVHKDGHELKPKTCDAPLCEQCTYEPAPGKDLCRTHRDLWLAMKPAAEPPKTFVPPQSSGGAEP
jgi:hypothetical protein